MLLFGKTGSTNVNNKLHGKILWQYGDEPEKPPRGTGNEEFEQLIELAGYGYDPQQDIFISTMNPWQRKVGYCRLYDQAAAPMGMIIDSEPIYFEYEGRKWMIGIWKGQYGLVSGGEIGVYKGIFNLNIPGIFGGIFYYAVDDEELLQMSYSLKKKEKTLLTREGKHWWLTGFKLGDFAEPSELTMEINITLDNEMMREAFVSGLKKAGYQDKELTINRNTVSFTFDIPRTSQPFTRTAVTDKLIQKKNKFLCDKYQEIAGEYDNMQDKIEAIERLAPELYQKIIRIGKTVPSYRIWIAAITIGIIFLLYMTQRSKNIYQSSSA